ncbi:MAG: FG-GAP-like repeat-containing protein [Patescibacteria group bacterium]
MEISIKPRLKLYLTILLFGLFVIFPKLALATEYYVAGDTGLDSNNGSISTPWQTIQKAADTMVAGDTVNVKGGVVYSSTSSCPFSPAVVCLKHAGNSNNRITFQSWPGTGIPELNGGMSANGFSFQQFGTSPSYTSISGFRIKNTNIGFYLSGSNINITNNIIYDTTMGNWTMGVISGQSSESDSTYIYNNLIYQKYLGVHTNSGVSVIKNNIITNCTNGIGANNGGGYVYTDIDYNNLFNNSSVDYDLGILQRGNHNVSVNPLFVDASIYNFDLTSSSSIVDAGANLSDITKDINGNSRPLGSGYDIGPYETSFTNSSPANINSINYYSPPINIMPQLATYLGEATGTQFGMLNTYSSTLIGDVNGDGFADVLVGGRHMEPNGGFYAFFGKQTPTDTQAINANAIIRGTITGSRISDNVSLGDIDGDGKNELLLTDYNAFKAYIFKTGSGFSSTDVSTANATISGPNHFGTGSTILGDVNGDGYDDYIVYADTGKKAYLFYGGPILSNKSYTDANVVYSVDSNITFTRPGDVNGDSLKDIVISCSSCNSGHGAIYIFYGGSNLTNKTLSQADVIITGDSSINSFGGWSALSDVNGDGIDDILTVSGFGKTYIFFGSSALMNKSSLQSDVVLEEIPNNLGNLGFSVESADINNDGYNDIITSNQMLPRTYVFYGGPNISSNSTSHADLVFDYIEKEKGYFGGPITTGDVNGDGYIEIATGNGLYNQRQGKVWLFGPPHGTPVVNLNSVGNTNNLTISGTVTDTQTVDVVEVSTDNGNWNNCTVTSSNFSCNLSTTLSDGSHSLRLRSKNSLGVYMATREYTSATFTFDHTSPKVDWTDTSGNSKKYESQGGDNVYTKDTLPTFTFSKSSDTTSGLTRYEIIIDGKTYIANIDPNKPSDKDYREDDDKYIKYDGDNISVRAKKDSDKLVSGKAYRWKVRAVDSADNSTDTAEKILRINTYQANFSGTFFPISLLTIGGKNTSITSIHPDQVPSNFSTFSTTPTLYGIAPVGTKVTLKIEKENDNKSGRDLVFSKTSTADDSSRFGINVTDKLVKQEYFINLSAVNPQGDYTEIPEFQLVVGGSSNSTVAKTPSKSLTTIQSVLESTNEVLAPVTTPLPKPIEPPKESNKHCFLWWCW